jgi:hypothetical protein
MIWKVVWNRAGKSTGQGKEGKEGEGEEEKIEKSTKEEKKKTIRGKKTPGTALLKKQKRIEKENSYATASQLEKELQTPRIPPYFRREGVVWEKLSTSRTPSQALSQPQQQLATTYKSHHEQAYKVFGPLPKA